MTSNANRISHPAPQLFGGTLDVPDFGVVVLVWSSSGLVELRLPPATGDDLSSDVHRAEPPREYAEVLLAYFRGEPVEPTKLPVDFAGTEFQRRVWQALREIPRGEVRSYQQIAAAIGAPRAMRAVGMANSRNPIPVVVPCHRVVQSQHLLGGFSAGLATKQHLLQLEGVQVIGDRVMPGQLQLIG